MNFKLKNIFSFGILALAGIFTFATFANASGNGNLGVKNGNQRNFNFKYQIKVPSVPKGTKTLDMWVPYPTNNEDQVITNVTIDSPVPVKLGYDSEWGNGILYLKINNPKPEGFTFIASYDVLRNERKVSGFNYNLKEIPAGNGAMDRYLRPSKYAIINDKVVNFSEEATKGKNTKLAKAQGIYDWIIGKMDYNKQIPGYGKGDVERACLSISGEGKGYGNCTDFHSLFSSMMQVQEIPVKFEMGYPLKPGQSQDFKKGGYHCWAKFYVAGYGWIPVDISEARKDLSKKKYFWGAVCENRIKFSEGRDILLTPAPQNGRLNYFGPDPYIEVDGAKFTGFERLVAYKDNK